MSWGGPAFVIAIIALSYGAWIATTWIRSRHGYPIENEWGGMVSKSDLMAERKIELLTNENAKLTDKIGRLEERIAVLERIATDAPARLSAEIERLK
ncbi:MULTISPECIES: hypothetical protein [Sphingobium]|uniref:Uncharacterized protein n=1 Tax=Sphingobium lignivorans TaxID=2735886 RepID=A0ABR6NK69_9SPHN|nr:MULTISPECIES: hypothetical protein [Sphingobium]MBB5987656.1 hypothetical protein [Sphingobium lignivorans]BAK68289.1 hypothetical protein SLG_36140 [Sphingobium sp. SYK-6]